MFGPVFRVWAVFRVRDDVWARGDVRIWGDGVRRPVVFSCSGRVYGVRAGVRARSAAAGKSRFVRAAVAGTVCAPSGRAGEELKDTGRGVGYDRAGPYRSG